MVPESESPHRLAALGSAFATRSTCNAQESTGAKQMHMKKKKKKATLCLLLSAPKTRLSRLDTAPHGGNVKCRLPHPGKRNWSQKIPLVQEKLAGASLGIKGMTTFRIMRRNPSASFPAEHHPVLGKLDLAHPQKDFPSHAIPLHQPRVCRPVGIAHRRPHL